MIDYSSCRPDDIRTIEVQAAQEPDQASLIGIPDLAGHGMNFAGRVGGRLVAVGGVVCKWPGTGKAWCLLAPRIGAADMMMLTHFTRELLKTEPYRRVETSVLCDFEAGHRWMTILGFTMEAERMVGYDPAGRDCALYARVRGSV